MIYWLIHQYSGTAPATAPPHAGPDPDAPADPAPNPLPPAWPVAQLAARLLAQNAHLSGLEANTIAAQCLWLTSRAALNNPSSACKTTPIFATGSNVREATLHDADALMKWAPWVQLNYESSVDKNPNWKNSPCQTAPVRTVNGDCDEFPFLSTVQGGGSAAPVPDLEKIDPQDNQEQGRQLSRFGQVGFYPECLRNVQGERFLVIPLVVPVRSNAGEFVAWDTSPVPTQFVNCKP